MDSKEHIKVSLRELMGKDVFIQYYNSVIVPALRNIAERCRIDPIQYKSMMLQLNSLEQMVRQKGIGVLDVPVDIFDVKTKNTKNGGYFGIAVQEITDGYSIHLFVKCASKKEHKKAVWLQECLYKELVRIDNPEFEGKIQRPELKNSKKRILITAYSNGNCLADELKRRPRDEQERLLKQVITDYAFFFKELNEPEQEVVTRLKLPNALERMEPAFIKRYLNGRRSGKARLVQTFVDEIGNELDGSMDKLIHGDLHPKNIIMGEKGKKLVYIDWEFSGGGGYYEYDIGKLLSFSCVDLDLEERLAEHAASELFTTEDEQIASVRRYAKSQIRGDLFFANRYLLKLGGVSNEEQKTKDYNRANAAYNQAIRRIRRAETRGIVSQTLLDEILMNPPAVRIAERKSLTRRIQSIRRKPLESKDYALQEISNEGYQELMKRYNPYQHELEGSLSNEQSRRSLIDTATKSIEELVKGFTNLGDRYRLKRKALKVALPLLGSLALVVAGFGVKNTLENAENAKIRAANEIVGESNYLVEEYVGCIEHSYKLAIGDAAEGRLKNRFALDSNIIDQVAQENSLDPRLLRNMLTANRYTADLGRSHVLIDGKEIMNPTFEDINFLYPFRYCSPLEEDVDLGDPVENLTYGAKKLTSLIKQYGNLKEAITEFYLPLEYLEEGITAKHKESFSGLTRSVNEIIYIALNGLKIYKDPYPEVTHIWVVPSDVPENFAVDFVGEARPKYE